MQPESALDHGMLALLREPTPRTVRLLDLASVPGSAYALEVSAFFDTHGRLPEPGAPEEKRLYRCLQVLRRHAGAPDTGKLFAALDGIPGLDGYPGNEVEDRLEAIIRWSEVHGRVPSAYSDNPDERRLNRSWKAVRKQHPALSAKGRERFDSVQARYRRLQSSTKRPGLSDPERQDLDLQLEKLKAWCAEHGHLPRGGRILDEPAGRAKERRLAHWMSHRISPRQGKSPTAHRQRIRAEILALKAQYPSYRAYRKAKEAERSARDRAGLQVLSGTLRGTEEGPASRQAPQADD